MKRKSIHQQLMKSLAVLLPFIAMILLIGRSIIRERARMELPPEEQRIIDVIGLLSHQHPRVFVTRFFDSEFFSEKEGAVFDNRRGEFVNQDILTCRYTFHAWGESSSYQKEFDSKTQHWIFTFPSGSKIYLAKDTLLVTYIHDG